MFATTFYKCLKQLDKQFSIFESFCKELLCFCLKIKLLFFLKMQNISHRQGGGGGSSR